MQTASRCKTDGRRLTILRDGAERPLESEGDPAGTGTHRPESSKLQLDPAWPASHRADHDVHAMPQLCHQLQQLGFADTSKLAPCDARDFRLINPQLRGGL